MVAQNLLIFLIITILMIIFVTIDRETKTSKNGHTKGIAIMPTPFWMSLI